MHKETSQPMNLKFEVGQTVVITRGDLKMAGVILKRKPEYRLYLISPTDSLPKWIHEDQLISLEEANML